MAVCGPKLSLCVLILSVWGILQLSVMGILFYTHSLAFAEDLPGFGILVKFKTAKEHYKAIDDGYSMAATNCWIAAGLYVVALAVSVHQFWLNSRSSTSK